MKNIFIFFIFILSNCSKPLTNKLSVQSFDKNGYHRESCDGYDYISRFIDTLEERYYMDYELKYAEKSTTPSFFSYPTIKSRVSFSIVFEQLDGRNGKNSCIDSVDVYINNQIWRSGLYPYRSSCRQHHNNLPENVEGVYVNKNRQKETPILIVFHNDKIYFDTIVPLRFKQITIGHPGHGFFIKFEKALD